VVAGGLFVGCGGGAVGDLGQAHTLAPGAYGRAILVRAEAARAGGAVPRAEGRAAGVAALGALRSGLRWLSGDRRRLLC